MNHLFECKNPKEGNGFFEVPDLTLLNAFLNPLDTTSGLPPGMFQGLAIAAGQIDPGVVGNIAIAPYISEITLLLEGELEFHMMNPHMDEDRYTKILRKPEDGGGPGFTSAAVLMLPGTFFQLDNSKGSEPARVLYISTPSYVFEPGANGEPIYDDAIQIGNDWTALADQNWDPPELHNPKYSYGAREASIRRITARVCHA